MFRTSKSTKPTKKKCLTNLSVSESEPRGNTILYLSNTHSTHGCTSGMTSIVKFQSLSGIGDESPHCYILQIDDFKFLLDCGWEERNGTFILDNLRYHAKQIDAILISHPGKFEISIFLDDILMEHVGTYIQCRVQLTDTPIFAIFGQVSVNSQMSVNLRTLKMSFFCSKSHRY